MAPLTVFPEIILQTFSGENLAADIFKMIVTEQDAAPYWSDKGFRVEKIGSAYFLLKIKAALRGKAR